MIDEKELERIQEYTSRLGEYVTYKGDPNCYLSEIRVQKNGIMRIEINSESKYVGTAIHVLWCAVDDEKLKHIKFNNKNKTHGKKQ